MSMATTPDTAMVSTANDSIAATIEIADASTDAEREVDATPEATAGDTVGRADPGPVDPDVKKANARTPKPKRVKEPVAKKNQASVLAVRASGMSKAAASKGLGALKRKGVSCFKSAGGQSPLTLYLMVGDDGRVTHVGVRPGGPAAATKLKTCVRSTALGTRFAPPVGDEIATVRVKIGLR